MVVLDEVDIDAGGPQLLAPQGLDEESACVAVDGGRHVHEAGQACRANLHPARRVPSPSMPDTETLALVVVAHGAPSVLTALLDGLSPQLRGGDEVIVVDNACLEGTAAVADGHPCVSRVLRLPVNRGYAGGANDGTRVARAQVVVICNQDLLPEPGLLDALRSPPPGWGAWGPVLLLPDGRIDAVGCTAHVTGIGWARHHLAADGELDDGPQLVPYLSGACLAIRRETFDGLGGFCASMFMYGEDMDLGHRLRLAGVPFGVIPAARVRHDHVVDKGAMKWRLMERNRHLTVLRTYPFALWVLLGPALLIAELAIFVAAVRGGWWKQKLLGHVQAIAAIPRTLIERRQVQRTRRVSAAAFARALTADIDSPLVPTGLVPRGLARALGGYLAAVIVVLTAADWLRGRFRRE